ncbi:MAG: DUF4019 domain-containing protein [Pyrinomonadaceae bacterium]
MQNHEVSKQATITAAEKWLALVDNDDSSESWNQAASFFKSVVSSEQWKTSYEAAQVPLGKVVSRKLKSQKYAEELPGAPDGEYVVIEYETSFEKKKNGTETITLMKDTDGEWRAAGYFVK